jgi:uncharacterized membrane protein
MSTTASAAPARVGARPIKAVALAAIFLVAAGFVFKYVFRYYLHYNEAAFDDPNLGGANYWSERAILLTHITSGMVALLIGPFQFSRRLRQRYLGLHRVMGRVYLIAVLCGSLAAIGLAVTTTFGPLWGFSLVCLALAWSTCGAMAFYAVKQGQIAVHQEWMVRTYTVTFAFVTFRVLNDYGWTSRIGAPGDRADVYIWACWVIPMMAAEVWMQLGKLRRIAR